MNDDPKPASTPDEAEEEGQSGKNAPISHPEHKDPEKQAEKDAKDAEKGKARPK